MSDVQAPNWTPSEVVQRLKSLALGKYGTNFLENDINGEALVCLTDEHLKELGVTLIGHRINIINFINGIKNGGETRPKQTKAPFRDIPRDEEPSEEEEPIINARSRVVNKRPVPEPQRKPPTGRKTAVDQFGRSRPASAKAVAAPIPPPDDDDDGDDDWMKADPFASRPKVSNGGAAPAAAAPPGRGAMGGSSSALARRPPAPQPQAQPARSYRQDDEDEDDDFDDEAEDDDEDMYDEPRNSVPMYDDDDNTMRVSCRYCDRKFASDRIATHEKICAKSKKSKRKVYDARQMRLQGTDAAKYAHKINDEPTRPRKDMAKFRREHQNLVDQLRAARAYTKYENDKEKGKAVGPPPTMPAYEPVDDDRVQCPNCGRKFAADAAKRHIPVCERSHAGRGQWSTGSNRRGGRR